MAFVSFFSGVAFAVPRKNPLPAREVEIGHRLMSARKAKRYSRALLARFADIDPSMLVRVEIGRAPLKYEPARRMLERLGVRASWLANGTGRIDAGTNLIGSIPAIEDLGITQTALFSEVFDRFLSQPLTPRLASAEPAPVLGEAIRRSVSGRRTALKTLNFYMRDWFLKVPDSKINLLFRELRKFGNSLVKSFPKEDWQTILQRAADWDALESRIAEAAKTKGSQTFPLPNISESVNHLDVKAQLPNLLERLRKATAARGTKSALAKYLKVPLASVSQWLSGEREPGGETTLRLLQWVEQQEAK